MRPLSLALAALLAACGAAPVVSPDELEIQILLPSSISSGELGSLDVSILDEKNTTVGNGSLRATSVKTLLVERLALAAGKKYQVRIDGKAPCELVGQSPLFVYQPTLGQIVAYVDCTDTFSSTTGGMNAKHTFAAAAHQPDPAPHGRVVVAGGIDPKEWNWLEILGAPISNTVEAFNPAAGTFAPFPDALLNPPRFKLQASAVGSSLWLTGGFQKGESGGRQALKMVEELVGDKLERRTEMNAERAAHQAVVVTEGALPKLVLAGGQKDPLEGSWHASVEVYDAKSQRTTRLPTNMSAPRSSFVALQHDSDHLLLAGGGDAANDRLCLRASCGCDPPCIKPTTAKLSGRVALAGVSVTCGSGAAAYLIGGSNDPGNCNTTYSEIYCIDSSQSDTMTIVGKLHTPRAHHTATLLADGRVLVAGGANLPSGTRCVLLDSAETFRAQCPCPPANSVKTEVIKQLMKVGRAGHTATLLPDGTVLLAGGTLAGTAASAERFNPRR